jgi:zinc transport system ATP-binding protein
MIYHCASLDRTHCCPCGIPGHVSRDRTTGLDKNTLVRANNIGINFAGRQILQHVALEIRQRQVVTLIGPNGAGKTTLVRIVLGLLKPDVGQVERAADLRIGYMPQKLQIESTLPLTVKRFLQLAYHARQTPVEEVLQEVRISHLMSQQISALSGGELQRVLLARALIQSPQLLVLDEPAQGVDVAGQAELYQLINEIRDRHDCGVLMISHDLHLVMATTDEVICLNQHICCHGKPEHVSADPSYIAMFGPRAPNLAVYTHHHNHQHDITGKIIEKNNG